MLRRLHWETRTSELSPRSLSGDDGDRTHDLRLAKPALYQLSYIPDESPFYSPRDPELAREARRRARSR